MSTSGQASRERSPVVDSVPNELPAWLTGTPRSCLDPLGAARALRPIIEAGAAEGARQGYISEDVSRAIASSGLWGLRLPRVFGGMEADPRTYIDVIEELSYADPSTGWAFMAASFAAGQAVNLGPSALEAIYRGDNGFITAGQVSTLGRAQAVEGGYRVQGDFHFGSGSQFASWFLGAFALFAGEQPVLDDLGQQTVIVCFTSRKNVRLKGNWDVMGLAATGSVDFEFIDQMIPLDFVLGVPGRPDQGGPTHKIGVSIGHCAWALGAGKRALDEIFRLAQRKRRFKRATLIDQPVFQKQYGEHLATLQAARALAITVFADWFDAAKSGKPSLEVRAQARLASAWATDVALKVGQFAMFSAGSDGVRNNGGENTIQRVYRDLQVGATHRHVDGNILIEASQVALRVADPTMVDL